MTKYIIENRWSLVADFLVISGAWALLESSLGINPGATPAIIAAFIVLPFVRITEAKK